LCETPHQQQLHSLSCRPLCCSMRLSLARAIRYAPRDFTKYDSGLGRHTTDYSNLPQRYIKRKITKVDWRSPNLPQYATKMRSFVPVVHNTDRPWTSQYWAQNQPGLNLQRKPRAHVVEPIREEDWMWFRGDRVELLTGPDKGKHGIINMIVQERNWVTVEGLNCEYENMGETPGFPGMMVKRELPLLVTRDIRLVDPHEDRGVEVEWRYTEGGERVRVTVETGVTIPIPRQAAETIDYKQPESYKPNEYKDTPPKEVEAVTYEPSLETFEMNIMREMGISETRVPSKTYWY